jgi:DNA-directed RNA polymerase subunit beta'
VRVRGWPIPALKTADSGYLTRRLVDVAQDRESSASTIAEPSTASSSPGSSKAGEIIEPLRDRIVGRVSLEKIKDYDGNVIVDVNNEITEDLAGCNPSSRH